MSALLLPLLAVLFGAALLVWSAERFVDGAAVTARRLGVPVLLVGMVIVGFGTSSPEMVISALASWQGNPGLALGNAYGSNIANIGLILGLTAVVRPVTLRSGTVRKELPLLAAVTALSVLLLWDGTLSRSDTAVMLLVFSGLLGASVLTGLQTRGDALGAETIAEYPPGDMSLGWAVFWLFAGLALLVTSSRILVWGAVAVAQALGVSDLVIGLTVVALGTSLPELASSIAAVRKGEDDLAIGNVVGSNLFNTLVVVGIAGMIRPGPIPPELLWRDLPVVALLTIALIPLAVATNRPAMIGRLGGGLLMACFLGYTAFLIVTASAPGPAPMFKNHSSEIGLHQTC